MSLLTSQITNDNGEGYDGDGDGVPGPGVNISFHRMFGDYTADRIVNAVDFAGFRRFFGLDTTSPDYRHYFDVNNDGITNAVDFAAFREVFGTILP